MSISRNLPSIDFFEPISGNSRLSDLDADLHIPSINNFGYYSVSEFNNCTEIKECLSKNKAFSALHCNIRSLSANYDSLHQLLTEVNCSFSLIGLSETKILRDRENLMNINLEGYNFIHEPTLSNAGGVGFYVKNEINYIMRNDLSKSTLDFEMLWIEIIRPMKQNIICGVVYRHPKNSPDNFFDSLSTVLEKINRENKLCMSMGDFNIDLIKLDTHHDSQNFMNVMSSYFFQPYIIQPTRITDHTATLIDNIFFNSVEYFVNSGNLIYELTDHLPNFIIFNELSDIFSDTNSYKRDYSRFVEAEFINEVKTIDWQYEKSELSNPSLMFSNFLDKLSPVIDKHIPLKKVSNKQHKYDSKPWITKGLQTSIKIKNNLYKRYLKTRSSYYHTKFKVYRNKINHLIKNSKRNYYTNYFKRNANDSKHIWNGIKKIVNFKQSSNRNISKILKENNELTNPKDIADAFNDYFASVGSDLASKIDIVDQSPMSYLKTPLSNSFFMIPITSEEVEAEISQLNSGKATGPFSIPIKILKLISSIVSQPLSMIFNASFTTGLVPSDFKIANVIPVYKKDSQLSLSNYRPISLLSVFNKLLEKLMAARLWKFLDKNNIIFDKQFGFRNNHSTDFALLSIVDKIQKAIDEKNYSCGIFLDFSKAFDTVNHDILLKKLEYYGIRGLSKSWFKSYLEDRKQSVIINNVYSNLIPITCGIPQGSVLGPILFLLYINDFHLCSSLFDFHLFADDASLFYKNNNINDLKEKINSELIKIHTWLSTNKLSLNIDKSNFVIFHPRQRKIAVNINFEINNKQLKQTTTIKYLGVHIDANLNWNCHVNYVTKKIKRNVGVLSKLRYYVSLDTLISLYYSLLYPFIIYGILTWGNTYPTTLDPIFMVQKKAVRIITFSSYDAPSSQIFKDLKILKIHDLVQYNVAVFMFKFNNKTLPPVFNHFFKPLSDIHKYNTRSASKNTFYPPKARTNFGIFNIRYQGTKIWNSLEEKIKNYNLSGFKVNIKNNFINNY